MKRREFITLIGGAAATWSLAAHAQQAGKIYRIGFLANDPAIPAQPAGQAFLKGLRESGFMHRQVRRRRDSGSGHSASCASRQPDR